MQAFDLTLVECPRDALQGFTPLINYEKKAAHINRLIDSGLFKIIDFGSFVSPKAVPQMADTVRVLEKIKKSGEVKLLAIVLNERGAEDAVKFEKIDYLGYPFSISEEFQQRNAHSSIDQSFQRLEKIVEIARSKEKEVVVYISMGFGNPYGDTWSIDLVIEWVRKIAALGVTEFSLADTTSEATPELIKEVFLSCLKSFPSLNIGVHLHSDKVNAKSKIIAAFEGGCRKFDGALLGYGGCPFAEDDLVGNIPTESLLRYFKLASEEQIQELQVSFLEVIE